MYAPRRLLQCGGLLIIINVRTLNLGINRQHILEKWFPFQGERASSFLVVVFIHVIRKEEEEGETDQQQFTKGCNILHRLQVYHLTLTFIALIIKPIIV